MAARLKTSIPVLVPDGCFRELPSILYSWWLEQPLDLL